MVTIVTVAAEVPIVMVKVKFSLSTPYRRIGGIGQLVFDFNSNHKKIGNLVTKLPQIIVVTLVTTKVT